MQHHGRAGTVVAFELAGRHLGLPVTAETGGLRRREKAHAENLLDLCAGNFARAKKAGAAGIPHIHDRRLKADARRSAIQYVGDLVPQPAPDVIGGGRTDVAEGVCARRREGPAGQRQKPAQEGVGGGPHRDARPPRRDFVGN